MPSRTKQKLHWWVGEPCHRWQNENQTLYKLADLKPPHSLVLMQTPSHEWELNISHFFHSSARGKPHTLLTIAFLATVNNNITTMTNERKKETNKRDQNLPITTQRCDLLYVIKQTSISWEGPLNDSTTVEHETIDWVVLEFVCYSETQ